MPFISRILLGLKSWLVPGVKTLVAPDSIQQPETINWVGDALCFVLANDRQSTTVQAMLDYFLPNHAPLTEDYNLSDEDLGVEFADEAAMLFYFQNNLTRDATRYWYPKTNNPADYMIGAHFTVDGCLLLSLTMPGNEIDEIIFLSEMKQLLQSEAGLIWYNSFPSFVDGQDFAKQYSSFFNQCSP